MIRNPDRLEWIKKMNALTSRPVKVTIGNNTKIDPTAKIGEPGHTIEKDAKGNWVRCKHFGDVIIKDGVHIGEFVVIKRATVRGEATIIGEDSKICAFVNVGHNCKMGKHVFVAPHVLMNGGVEIGDDVWISGHAVIRQHARIGPRAIVGMGAVVNASRTGGWDVPPGETVVGIPAVPIRFVGNHVHPSFKSGVNLEMGKFNHIYEGVEVGDNVKIKSYVELRTDTVIGDDCYLDSGVKSSGQNRVGDRVTLRYDSIIARGVIIEDDVFISPQFMTENLNHKGEEVGGAYIGTGEWDRKTKYRVFIGTDVTLAAGIEICSGAIIGSKANVRNSITELGVYVGNPARRLR
jgi:UDP-3-O-[3-hydroxymyristoyl] glucosamine N-acyltransferase